MNFSGVFLPYVLPSGSQTKEGFMEHTFPLPKFHIQEIHFPKASFVGIFLDMFVKFRWGV